MTRRALIPALLSFACASAPARDVRSSSSEALAEADTPPSVAAPKGAALQAPPVDCENGDGEPNPEDVTIIQPEKRVPDFHVATTGCEVVHADQVIGDKPLVLVFFSSWCNVCDKKMPVIREAIEEIGDEARFIGVALDDDDSWADVQPFLDEHGVTLPVVRGHLFRRFSLAYNPFRSIPVVVVVGNDGLLVDLQLGYSPFDKNRLLGAVAIGKRGGSSTSDSPLAPVPEPTPCPAPLSRVDPRETPPPTNATEPGAGRKVTDGPPEP